MAVAAERPGATSVAVDRDDAAGVTLLSRGQVHVIVAAPDEGAVVVATGRVSDTRVAVFSSADVDEQVAADLSPTTRGAAVTRRVVAIVTGLARGRVELAIPAGL